MLNNFEVPSNFNYRPGGSQDPVIPPTDPFGNSTTRARVSLMDLQYVFRYRLNPMFSVGFAPNMQWDQVTGVVTMPVGFGFDTMTMVGGKMPIRWGAELQYFASHEDSANRVFDPEWNFRLYVSPIIKAPEWATQGLFGGGSKNCHCNRCGRCRSCR